MTDLTPRPTPEPSSPRRRRRTLPMLVLALVIAAGGVIVVQFLRSAVDYYCNVDEIGTRSGCDADRRLRIQGTVDEASISTERNVTTFTVSFNGAVQPVRYDGEPGGIFKECIPVVVHGALDGPTFVGDRIEVRHSNEYVAVNSDRIDEAELEAELRGCDTGDA